MPYSAYLLFARSASRWASSAGGFDLYNADQGTATSRTVVGLPADGRMLFVRLWSLIGGAWQARDYTYQAP